MTRRDQKPRDQEPTPFTRLLDTLCRDSGAHCAALVDAEGETVDYGGRGDPFDIRILAAELRLLQQHILAAAHLGKPFEVVVRAKKRSFLVVSLPEGYALAVALPRYASGISQRALSVAVRDICHEAGFDPSREWASSWQPIAVREEGRTSCRPLGLTLDGTEHALEVLGRLTGDVVSRREQGFRIRLVSGEERNLVREALGHWYLEED